MNAIHVFITSVQSIKHVQVLSRDLDGVVGKGNWNFALDDCDKILRVCGSRVNPEMTIRILHDKGFECRELDY